MVEQHSTQLEFDDPSLANQLFGPQNQLVTDLAKLSGLTLYTCSANLTLQGNYAQVKLVQHLFLQMYKLLKKKNVILHQDILAAYQMLLNDSSVNLQDVFSTRVLASPRRQISPKTLSQYHYIQAMRHHDLVIAVGPAGTGKTYLAVSMALERLHAKKVKRIILTRPAVEAGEKLGFLPGDMAQKVNPYLRPLYDALYDMLDAEKVNAMQENGSIEIAPLAFMRGRTLSNAFIILDEAQNTTPQQMKMFVTRLGFGSQMVIAGDITQIDLPRGGNGIHSGLIHLTQVLDGMSEIPRITFRPDDVIRHPLVGQIVQAYDKYKSANS